MPRDEQRVLKRNVYAYYAAALCRNLSFTLPIYVLFFKNYIGITYTQVSIIAIAMSLSQIGFDFASGTFADAVGRKTSYLMGVFMNIIGMLIVVSTREFSLLFLAAVISGAGAALASNTLDADLHDSLIERDLEKKYIGITSTVSQFAFLGRVVSGIMGGLFFVIGPRLPYLAEIAALAGGMTVIYFFFSVHIPRQKKESTFKTMHLALSFLKHRRDIMLFCLLGALGLFSGDLMFGYYQPYFNTLHANTVLMGATYSVIAIFSILGAHIGKKLVPRYSPYFMSSLLLWGTIITAFLMLAENQYLAFAATFVLAIPFGFSNATLRHFLNSQSPSNIKSSIASFGTTLYAAGTMLGLAAAGILADHFAPRTILMCIIAVSAVILVLNKTISQSRNASQTA